MFGRRSPGRLRQRDDAVRAEPGGVGERGTFGDSAASGERDEVAARRAVVPRAPAFGDELVDAEVAQPSACVLVADDREARRARGALDVSAQRRRR